MLAKSVRYALSIGILGCVVAMPAKAEIIIQSGALSGNLNYNYENPLVPTIFVLESLDVKAFRFNTDIGTLSNFEGAAQLTKINVTGSADDGKATIGTNGSWSGLITGRSQVSDGQVLQFNNNLITIVGVVTESSDVDNFTQTGTITVTGGKIQTDSPTNVSQPANPAAPIVNQPNIVNQPDNQPNFGSNQPTGSVTLTTNVAASDQFIDRLAPLVAEIRNDPNYPDYVMVDSTSRVVRIPGAPSRIHYDLTAPGR